MRGRVTEQEGERGIMEAGEQLAEKARNEKVSETKRG